MGFKSDNQRKGFFASLKEKYSVINARRHEDEKRKLLEKINQETDKLKEAKKEADKKQEEIQLKAKLESIKLAKEKIQKENFEKSNIGHFTNKVKSGVIKSAQDVSNYEKKHYKGQLRELKRLFK